MPYTVWSRGRLIGETDLGFRPFIELSRSGWFHPNLEGERLMPVVASVLPAMRAYLHRDAVDASGNGFVLPELRGSTLFADLAESFQHLESLELELRREDGSVVPTAWIGIQDMRQLRALAEETLLAEEESVEDPLTEDAEGDEQFDVDALDGDEPADAPIEDWMDGIPTTRWTSEDDLDDSRFPRYQIHLQLLRGGAIP